MTQLDTRAIRTGKQEQEFVQGSLGARIETQRSTDWLVLPLPSGCRQAGLYLLAKAEEVTLSSDSQSGMNPHT